MSLIDIARVSLARLRTLVLEALGAPFQKPLRARPCALVSGHPWPSTFLEGGSQCLYQASSVQPRIL